MLRRILVAHMSGVPTAVYSQSFSFLAGFFLLMPGATESIAYALLNAVARLLPGWYAADMAGMRCDLLVLEALIESHLPRVHAHAHVLGVPMALMFSGLLSAFFIGSLPADSVVRLFDAIGHDLLRDKDAPFFMLLGVSLAILRKSEPELLESNDLRSFKEAIMSKCNSWYDGDSLIAFAKDEINQIGARLIKLLQAQNKMKIEQLDQLE